MWCCPTSSTTPASSTRSARALARPARSTPTPTSPSSSDCSRRLRATACAGSSPTESSRWKVISRRCPRLSSSARATTRCSSSTTRTGLASSARPGVGSPEHFDLLGRVDVITGTLGKALGGAAGGFVAGSEQRRRVADPAVAARRCSPTRCPRRSPPARARRSNVMRREPERVARLHANAQRLRTGLRALGYDCEDTPSAIIPIVLGDAREVERCSARLFELGVLVVGFSFPVVPNGAARLRVQASAGLTDEQLDVAARSIRGSWRRHDRHQPRVSCGRR